MIVNTKTQNLCVGYPINKQSPAQNCTQQANPADRRPKKDKTFHKDAIASSVPETG